MATENSNKIKSLWISFDLGLKGDYSNLYAWLDEMKAKECGRNLAYIRTGKYAFKNPAKELLEDIQKQVKLNETDRLYISYLNDDTGKINGRFIHGVRVRNPWEGYAISKNTDTSDEDGI